MSPQLDTASGWLYAGVLAATALWGVSVAQAWYYFNNYREDKTWVRVLVAVTWILATIHQIMITQMPYWYLILNFDHPENLSRLEIIGRIESLFKDLTAILVQCFFATRIWRLGRKHGPVLMVLIGACVLGEIVCSVGWTIASFEKTSILALATGPANLYCVVYYALTTACDLLMAVALSVMLYRSRSGAKKSDTVVHKLMLFSLNTGLLAGILAISVLLTFVLAPASIAWAGLSFVTSGLSLNSLLAHLNARRRFRKSMANTVITLPVINFSPPNQCDAPSDVRSTSSLTIDPDCHVPKDSDHCEGSPYRTSLDMTPSKVSLECVV